MYCDWPQLRKCCFCMPLRKGVLMFGYIHLVFSAFMVFNNTYSSDMEATMAVELLVYGRLAHLQEEICIAMFCLEVIFDGLLIYGAHNKAIAFLKAYFYYTMVTGVALLMMQILEVMKIERSQIHHAIEIGIFTFGGFCLQIYLVTMVWSLMKKFENSGPHLYDNQLQQIVSGEPKVQSNSVYNNTTVMPVDV